MNRKSFIGICRKSHSGYNPGARGKGGVCTPQGNFRSKDVYDGYRVPKPPPTIPMFSQFHFQPKGLKKYAVLLNYLKILEITK